MPESENVAVPRGFIIRSNSTRHANKLNIIIKGFRKHKYFHIDMTITSDRNICIKFDELSKYKDLDIEIAKIYHLKTTTVPKMKGARTIILTKNTRENVRYKRL